MDMRSEWCRLTSPLALLRQVAGGDDDVIAFAVRLFPHAVHQAPGVPTVQELQVCR